MSADGAVPIEALFLCEAAADYAFEGSAGYELRAGSWHAVICALGFLFWVWKPAALFLRHAHPFLRWRKARAGFESCLFPSRSPPFCMMVPRAGPISQPTEI